MGYPHDSGDHNICQHLEIRFPIKTSGMTLFRAVMSSPNASNGNVVSTYWGYLSEVDTHFLVFISSHMN